MTRALPPGSFHDMLGEALDAAGRKRAADVLGVTPAMLSRHADPDEDNGRPISGPRLDQLARHFAPSAAVIAQHFAALAGGAFIPAADASESLHASVARLGDASAKVGHALLSGVDPDGPGGAALTERELRAIADEAQEVIDTCRHVQARAFAQMRAGSLQ
jgi:hypothetical protein